MLSARCSAAEFRLRFRQAVRGRQKLIDPRHLEHPFHARTHVHEPDGAIAIRRHRVDDRQLAESRAVRCCHIAYAEDDAGEFVRVERLTGIFSKIIERRAQCQRSRQLEDRKTILHSIGNS
jgi:hypothetical protein